MTDKTGNVGPRPRPEPTYNTGVYPPRAQPRSASANPAYRNGHDHYGQPTGSQSSIPPQLRVVPPRVQRRRTRRMMGILLGVFAGAMAALCVIGGLVATMSGDPAVPDPRVSEVTALPPKSVTSGPVANGEPAKAAPSATAPATVATATGGFSDEGTLLVPGEVKPGTYRATVPVNSLNCYWARLSGTSNESGNILANGNAKPGAKVTVTIKSTDKAFHSSGCGAWSKVS